MTKAYVWTAPDASGLQLHAASELKAYLGRLFGIDAETVTEAPAGPGARFILGLADAPHVRQSSQGLPVLSTQGHLLRRLGPETMLLAGGSDMATAWAVYELIERYGVRYLLLGDALPQDPGPFHVPDVDVVLEPLTKLRSWRQFNDLPTGPAMWSLAQQRSFIRQLFKLKFNGVNVSLWPQHPFVDYEVSGIRRNSAALLFGMKIPIDGDNIGREHLPDIPYLTNFEMTQARTFPEMLEAGTGLLGGILNEAGDFGMHTCIAYQPMEFPLEFKPLLQRPAEGRIQLGALTCAESGDLTNPAHVDLVRATLEAYMRDWGHVDEIRLHLPEHPQAEGSYRDSWLALDSKYSVEKDYPLDGLLDQAGSSHVTSGGPARAERELKSAVSMLQFFDDFFSDGDLLARAADRNIRISLDLQGTAVPLLPVVNRLMWDDGGIGIGLGYTSSRAVRRTRYLEGLDAARVPADLVITLQDDNVGWLPQVATRNVDVLLRTIQRLGWRGFMTRFWPVGDLDPVAAYLARASWDTSTTPPSAHADHFSHVYGPASAEGLTQVMSILEDATVVLDLDFLSLFFPALGIMCRAIESEEPMPVGLHHVRAAYEECRRTLLRERDRVAPAGQSSLAYMISRLDFSVHALVEKELLSDGSVHVRKARDAGESGDTAAAEENLARARDLYRRAVEAGEDAIRAAATQVRDDSDRACLAAYYHFFVREVRERVSEVTAQ